MKCSISVRSLVGSFSKRRLLKSARIANVWQPHWKPDRYRHTPCRIVYIWVVERFLDLLNGCGRSSGLAVLALTIERQSGERGALRMGDGYLSRSCLAALIGFGLCEFCLGVRLA